MVAVEPVRVGRRLCFVECASDVLQEVIPRSNLRPLAARDRDQVMDQCLQDILQTQRSIPLQKGTAHALLGAAVMLPVIVCVTG